MEELLKRRTALKMMWLGALASCGASARSSDSGTSRDSRADDSDPGCRATRSDVVGPYYSKDAPTRAMLAGSDEPGERLVLRGTVAAESLTLPDGTAGPCLSIADALLDVWQADAEGRYFDCDGCVENVAGRYKLRGQLMTNELGYELHTIKPGNYKLGDGSWRPAHLHFTVSAPGFVSVTTQLYFAGDPYLAPHDGCGAGCGSDDPQRIVPLVRGADGWEGQWSIVLKKPDCLGCALRWECSHWRAITAPHVAPPASTTSATP